MCSKSVCISHELVWVCVCVRVSVCVFASSVPKDKKTLLKTNSSVYSREESCNFAHSIHMCFR